MLLASTHHSRSLCLQAAFALRGSAASSLLQLLACISLYCSRSILSALAVFACDVSCCFHLPITRAACVCRLHSHWGAQQPPACFNRLHVSVNTARAPYCLHSLFLLVMCRVACIYPSFAQLVSAGCIRIGGLSSLQPVSIACMYQSILLALYIFCTRCFRLGCVVLLASTHHSRSLCLQAAFALGGSAAFSLLQLLACISRYCSRSIFSAFAVFAYDVARSFSKPHLTECHMHVATLTTA